MTAPNFANIAPSQVAGSRRESDLAGMGEFLATLMANRAQIAAQREQLAMQREELNSDLEMDKIRKKEALAKLDVEDKKQRAASIVAQLIPGIVTSPDPLAAMKAARVDLIQKNKDIAPYLSDALDEQYTSAEKAASTTAERRYNTTQADVAGKTADATVTTKNREPEVQQAQLDQLRAARAAADAAQRTNVMSKIMTQWANTGLPMYAIRSNFNVGPLSGIPDDLVYIDPKALGAGGVGSEAERTNSLAVQQMQAADRLIASTMAATDGKGVSLASQLRRGTRVTTWDALLGKFSSPEQRQLVNAQRAYLGGYTLLMTGRAQTVAEAIRNAGVVLEDFGDDDATKQQKAFMRQVINQATFDITRRVTTPEDAAKRVADIARSMRMPQETQAYFDTMAQEAKDYTQRSKLTGVGLTVLPGSEAPTDNASRAQALLNARRLRTPRDATRQP